MAYLKDFIAKIEEENVLGVLHLWEEYCTSDEVDPQEFLEILEAIKSSNVAVPFGRYVERAIPIWETLEESDLSHKILQLIFDLQTTNSNSLHEIAVQYLTQKYGDQPKFDKKFRMVGLRGGKRSFQKAISNYDLLSHINKGKFVFHTAGWGVGEIMDFSLVREQITLEFDYVPGKKELSFEVGFNTLIPLADDHFLARRFGNPDSLEEEAKKSPLKVIHLLLRDLGPKTAEEIKEELCELVIPANEWGRWWQNVRSKIKKDTLIESPEKLKEPFRLRATEVSHEERLSKALETNPDADTFIQMIYSFGRDFSETLKNQEFKDMLIEKIKDVLLIPELSDAQKLQIYFFLEDFTSENIAPKIAEILKSSKNPIALIDEIKVISFKKRALVELRKNHENWKALFSELLFTVDQAPLRDYIINELKKNLSPEDLKEHIGHLFIFPEDHPEAFVWYFQKLRGKEKEDLPFSDAKGKIRSFESLLILLNKIENEREKKDLTKKIISLITASRYALVREVFSEASLNEVKEYVLLASKCFSLSDHDKKIFHSLAEVVYPSLGKGEKEGEYLDEENVIWCTKEGYEKTQNRMNEIANVEILENAKEIEVARSYGDLRENAEFKFALEKRDRLQAELKFLSDQINNARVLTPDDISVKTVGVGTVVQCKSAKGSIVSYTFLGPWEADPDKNIFSYQSKLAKSIKGLTLGETFQFQGEEYTITDISNYYNPV